LGIFVPQDTAMLPILLLGESLRCDAFVTKTSWDVVRKDSPVAIRLDEFSLVVDLDFDQYPERMALYSKSKIALFLLQSVRTRLSAVLAGVGASGMANRVAGINAWSGCLEADRWELMCIGEENEVISLLRSKLSFPMECVGDRVGMITPRVMAMIINEAYYTVQEGTASKADIDLGMQLGTNYPGGPFAWCEKWGIAEVYHLLEALWLDTREERYKICPLLKTEYLRSL
jgi:3-hydroxybutyryl-CoA dehydrogenase